MARRNLSIAEVLANKGIGAATERMNDKVAKELAAAVTADTLAATHRKNAENIKAEFNAAAKTQLDALTAASAPAPAPVVPA